MATGFQQHQAIHAFPDQAEFWSAWAERRTGGAAATRDFLGSDPERPITECVREMAPTVAVRARSMANGEPVLARILLAAVLAVVAARATDSDEVCVVSRGASGEVPAFPLCVEVDRETSFRTVLASARDDYARAAPHTELPVAFLLAERGSALIDFAMSSGGEPDLDGARAEDGFGASLHFDADLLGPTAAPALRLRYRTDLYAPETAQRLVHSFLRILEAVTADPDTPVGSLLEADASERADIARAYATDADYPDRTVLHAFLEQRAATTPKRTAVADDGTGYGQLNRRANRIAHRLRSLGVGRGDVVAVCLPRSPDLLAALYGVLKSGAAYLPIDPQLPAARISYMVEHSGVRVALCTSETRRALTGVAVLVDLDDAAVASADDTDPDSGVTADDPCYVIYTSGSTGRPKGVVVEHRAIVNRLHWMQKAYPLDEDDVILHKTPFTFDVSVWEIFWWSLVGAAVCTLPSGDERDPERIVARIAEHRVSILHFVPSMLQAFLRYLGTEPAVQQGRLSPLRRAFTSGEALPTETVQRFWKVVPGVALVNLYGPTEAAVDVSHFDCAAATPRRPVPIGRPIDNIQLYVLTRAGSEAPIGTPGELCIGGVGLARGYLNAPELTKERFSADVLPGAGRLYRTGDLARRLPDGEIEFLGRVDSQVKIRGHRIEPGEIEHVALRSGTVAQCAVVADRDQGGDAYLCAYVVPADGYAEAELRAALAAELPGYMIPRRLVAVASLPTNHNGKRDMLRLPELVGTVEPDVPSAPAGEAELLLAGIWRRVLGVEKFGVHDDFFSLGGDSIKAVVVLAELREAGHDLTFQELFAHPTVAEAAALIRPLAVANDEPARDGAISPFELISPEDRSRLPATVVDAYPLSALQAGLLYETAGSDVRGLYHDVACYRVSEPLDLPSFRTALARVVEEHPVWRTSFHTEGFSVPLQAVRSSVPLPLQVVDLSGLPADEQDRKLADFPAEELARGFTPGCPDLVRVWVHLLGDRGYQYCLSYHAAALDGWSVSVLNRDLFGHILGQAEGRAAMSSTRGDEHRSFVLLESEAAASDEQSGYWEDLLDGAEGTVLPRTQTPAHLAEESTLVMREVALPAGLSAGLLRVAADVRVPVKSVLLSAHAAVMAFLSGSQDVLVGYEQSGRPESAGAARAAALFLNTVPFRVALSGLSWADLVRQVYRSESEMLPYRRFPMSEMKRKTARQGPLFESVFNFTHFHVLKELLDENGFRLERTDIRSRTGFPFRAEFQQDAFGNELGFAIHYESGQFTAEQIDQVAGYYVRALQYLAEYPDEPLAARSLLDERELAELTRTGAGPDRELPDGTFLDVFAKQVAARPDEPAVSHGAELITYRELDDRSHRLACFLRSSGVGDGDVVAMPMDRGIPWAVCFLAVLKARAVYLPQDPADPPERLASMYRRSGCRHLLAGDGFPEALAEGASSGTPGPTVLRYSDAWRVDQEQVLPSSPSGDDPAYLIFTSGSTGEPKGALIHHRGMLNHLLAKCDDLGLGPDDRIAQVATQCFDISVWQLAAAWLVGGHSLIFGQELVSDLTQFPAKWREGGVTVLEVVPAYLDALLSEHERDLSEPSALRWVMVTGETLPPSLTRRWFQSCRVPLVNAYGPTEASDDITHHFITGPVNGDRVPVGLPIINTRIYVVGPDGRILPAGTSGEIVVTGAGVGLGYVRDEERTAAVFRPNRYDETSELVYHTGDVGRWLPSGALDCAGRMDHQVKLRGHRIELTEIESVLSRIPGCAHAVVLLRVVNGQKQLVAFYTGDAELSAAQIREHAGKTLPGYLLPDSLVRLDSFPLTRNGKVDRAALGRVEVGQVQRSSPEPPADALEAEILRAYADALGGPLGELGALDDFFEHGGHSLAAMKVASRLHGRAVLRDIVGAPTARGLASRIRTAAGGRPLLADLSPTAEAGMPAAVTVVCFPYAGGSAVGYVPLGRALRHVCGPDIRVLAADLPGRDSSDTRLPVPVGDLVRDLADEIARTAQGDLVLLGHSAGTGPALLTALALRRAGRSLAGFVTVAGLLRSLDPDDYGVEEAAGMTDSGVFDWLAEHTGLDTAGDFPPHARTDLARAFRYDAITAQLSYAAALREEEHDGALGCPVTVLLADDDPLTRDRAQDVGHWGRFGSALNVARSESGSHYLNTTRPGFIAEEIRRILAGASK